MESLVLAAALLLAFVNGANDNFKGVATLYGSGHIVVSTQSLTLATVSTLLGSLALVGAGRRLDPARSPARESSLPN